VEIFGGRGRQKGEIWDVFGGSERTSGRRPSVGKNMAPRHLINIDEGPNPETKIVHDGKKMNADIKRSHPTNGVAGGECRSA